MSAFVISEVEIRNEEARKNYSQLAVAAVTRYGGRYLVRGAQAQVVEGQPPTGRVMVVIEFPSMQRVREWYGSAEYAQALKFRDQAFERRLTFVEGVIPAG